MSRGLVDICIYTLYCQSWTHARNMAAKTENPKPIAIKTGDNIDIVYSKWI